MGNTDDRTPVFEGIDRSLNLCLGMGIKSSGWLV